MKKKRLTIWFDSIDWILFDKLNFCSMSSECCRLPNLEYKLYVVILDEYCMHMLLWSHVLKHCLVWSRMDEKQPKRQHRLHMARDSVANAASVRVWWCARACVRVCVCALGNGRCEWKRERLCEWMPHVACVNGSNRALQTNNVCATNDSEYLYGKKYFCWFIAQRLSDI